MTLSPMRYKGYTWPHNPRVYSIDYERKMAVNKTPFGLFHLQDLGRTNRIMEGEGEFVGPDAYAQFASLPTCSMRRAGAAGPPPVADGQRLFRLPAAGAGAQAGLCALFLCLLGGRQLVYRPGRPDGGSQSGESGGTSAGPVYRPGGEGGEFVGQSRRSMTCPWSSSSP